MWNQIRLLVYWYIRDASWVAKWLKTYDLRKLRNMKKISKSCRINAWYSVLLPKCSKNLLKNRNGAFPVVRYFTWKLEFVSYILWMIPGQKHIAEVHSEASQTTFNCFLKNLLPEMFDLVFNTPRQWPGNSRQTNFSRFKYFTEYKRFWLTLGGILNIFHFYK